MNRAAQSLGEGVEPGELQPRRAMLDEVSHSLSKTPKELSPKYFYDPRGSALFEEITELPEYYLTRTERSLLGAWIPDWIADLCPRTLVELGSGSSSKTRILLDSLPARSVFVPVDVSEELLEDTAEALRREYPQLTVAPEVGDISHPLDLPGSLPGPALFAFLGSTIGNFTPPAAIRLLSHTRASMTKDDAFLMGVDLRPGPGKSREELESAYNDSRGVTAEFNLNVLRVLNREIGSDFDLDGFAHRAVYNDEDARIEMHLVAERPQVVTIPSAGTFAFRKGETVRTEISAKYDRATVDALFAAAGLHLSRWREDDRGRYALAVGRPKEP